MSEKKQIHAEVRQKAADRLFPVLAELGLRAAVSYDVALALHLDDIKLASTSLAVVVQYKPNLTPESVCKSVVRAAPTLFKPRKKKIITKAIPTDSEEIAARPCYIGFVVAGDGITQPTEDFDSIITLSGIPVFPIEAVIFRHLISAYNQSSTVWKKRALFLDNCLTCAAREGLDLSGLTQIPEVTQQIRMHAKKRDRRMRWIALGVNIDFDAEVPLESLPPSATDEAGPAPVESPNPASESSAPSSPDRTTQTLIPNPSVSSSSPSSLPHLKDTIESPFEHPDHWALKGLLLVQHGVVQYRVYKGQVVHASNWFSQVVDKLRVRARALTDQGYIRRTPKGRVVILDRILERGDWEVWLEAMDNAITFHLNPPPMSTVYALLRASRALRAPAYEAYARSRIEEIWSADLENLVCPPPALKGEDATEALLLARKCGMVNVAKRAMYELLKHETFWQDVAESDDANVDAGGDVNAVMLGEPNVSNDGDGGRAPQKESEGMNMVVQRQRTKKDKLSTKDILLLTAARSQLQARWAKVGSLSSAVVLCGSSRVEGQGEKEGDAGSGACPGRDAHQARIVYRTLLHGEPLKRPTPPTPKPNAAAPDLHAELKFALTDTVQQYMRDPLGGYTQLLGMKLMEEGGFCAGCEKSIRSHWEGARESLWKDCDLLFGIGM